MCAFYIVAAWAFLALGVMSCPWCLFGSIACSVAAAPYCEDYPSGLGLF